MGARPGKKNMQSKVAHYQTPVNNLLLGGHWAELGGGVPIATKAGANSALMVFRKENKAIFNSMAAYMDGKIDLTELLANPAWKPYNDFWTPKPTPAQKKAVREATAGE